MAAAVAAGSLVHVVATPAAAAQAGRSSRGQNAQMRTSFCGSALQLRAAKHARVSMPLGPVRAVQQQPDTDTSTKEVQEKTQKLLKDVQARWEKVEDKPTVILYTGGALVALWFSSAIIGAFNSVPLLPKVLELVGVGYTGWFIYRYLLFTPNRQELLDKIDSITSQITGEAKDLADDAESAASSFASDAKSAANKIDSKVSPLTSKVEGAAKDVKSEVDTIRKY